MQKAFAPDTSEVAEAIREAMTSGRKVTISVACVTPRTKTEPPIAMTASLRLGLTRMESRAFAKLMENEHVTKTALHAAISQDDDPATNIKLVDVMIHKLRKKLDVYGVAITTLWGTGYGLTATSRDKLRKILADHGADHREDMTE